MPADSTSAKLRWPLLAGVVLGLAIAAGVLILKDRFFPPAGAPPTGPLLPECQGHFRDLVIQYVPDAAGIVTTAYRQFLPQLPPDVTVFVVCPDRPAFDDLCSRVGSTRCQLQPVFTHHAMTTWSRDRWLALAPPPPLGSSTFRNRSGIDRPTVTLLCARAEEGSANWPQRAGDERIGQDLAALLKGVRCRITDFRFDGGDFMADEQTVFVTSRVALANIQHTVQTRQELIDRLQTLLKKRVVLLDNAPDHHAAMFMMCVGNRTVLVSDPAWGKRLVEQMEAERQGGSAAARGVLASARLNAVVPTTQPSKPRPSGPGSEAGSGPGSGSEASMPSARGVLASASMSPATVSTSGGGGEGTLLCPPEGPDWSQATQALYDAVATQCQAEGYRVMRMPVVPGLQARRVLTYLNALIDVQDGHRIVYMPVYRNADLLNAAATKVWSDAGFEVRPIDCTDTYVHFGCLHCLVNVLRRDE